MKNIFVKHIMHTTGMTTQYGLYVVKKVNQLK